VATGSVPGANLGLSPREQRHDSNEPIVTPPTIPYQENRNNLKFLVAPMPNEAIDGSIQELGMGKGLRALAWRRKPIPNYCDMCLIRTIGHGSVDCDPAVGSTLVLTESC